MINLVLFQPDIALNVGTLMRLCACTGVRLHVIEPCGFPWNPRKIQQSALDYFDHVDMVRHASWDHFVQAERDKGRFILMTTKGAQVYTQVHYEAGDYLIAGSESAGAPDYVHTASDARIFIPMRDGLRSLNIACASAMIVGEALRQVGAQ